MLLHFGSSFFSSSAIFRNEDLTGRLDRLHYNSFKLVKGSMERYSLGQKHNMRIFGVIPFIKLQNKSFCRLIKRITPKIRLLCFVLIDSVSFCSLIV